MDKEIEMYKKEDSPREKPRGAKGGRYGGSQGDETIGDIILNGHSKHYYGDACCVRFT